jgi:hypothetical protein
MNRNYWIPPQSGRQAEHRENELRHFVVGQEEAIQQSNLMARAARFTAAIASARATMTGQMLSGLAVNQKLFKHGQSQAAGGRKGVRGSALLRSAWLGSMVRIAFPERIEC